MAIVSATIWQTFTGVTLTGAELASLTTVCGQVNAVINKLIRPYQLEPITQTQEILDAPIEPYLLTELVPVRSLTSVWLNGGANGDPSAFNLTLDLLTEFIDYQLILDMQPEGWSRSGRVRRVGQSVWGTQWRRPPTRLTAELDPNRGSVMLTYEAGHTSVPADVTEAACLNVSLILKRKLSGAPAVSESWNGYSASLASAFLQTAAILSPDVIAALAPYMSMFTGSR